MEKLILQPRHRQLERVLSSIHNLGVSIGRNIQIFGESDDRINSFQILVRLRRRLLPRRRVPRRRFSDSAGIMPENHLLRRFEPVIDLFTTAGTATATAVHQIAIIEAGEDQDHILRGLGVDVEAFDDLLSRGQNPILTFYGCRHGRWKVHRKVWLLGGDNGGGWWLPAGIVYEDVRVRLCSFIKLLNERFTNLVCSLSSTTMEWCKCGAPTMVRTSWTNTNPGRRFYCCSRNVSRGLIPGSNCPFLGWVDPAPCNRCMVIIPGLLRSKNSVEGELKAKATEAKKWKALFYWSWILVLTTQLLSSLTVDMYNTQGQVGPSDEGPTDEGPTDDGPTDDGPTDDGPTDDGPPITTIFPLHFTLNRLPSFFSNHKSLLVSIEWLVMAFLASSLLPNS
ncbi:hypothetical protein OSB04_004230 [Centaurea solstitialis]|uniref:GRF-type domain-containing protein n=1 Tax=Centaurea solstitialis TaxID=347529 RepID=A0AA38WVI9_9ASTR|nr:hypothetical protein OSB04_004230 [Centaurea solstitialis]